MSNQKGTLIRYFRNRRGVRLGVFVAERTAYGVPVIGWAKCHTSLDRFDPKRGVELAKSRIHLGSQRRGVVSTDANTFYNHLPHSMIQDADGFVDACRRYFKTDEVFMSADEWLSRIDGNVIPIDQVTVLPQNTPEVKALEILADAGEE